MKMKNICYLYYFMLAVALPIARVYGNTHERSPGTTVPGVSSGGTVGIKATLPNPVGANTTLFALLGKVLDVMVSIGFPILVLALVYSGFLFVKAQGNPTEIETAKKAFFWTVVGGVVLLGSSILAGAIGGTVDAVKGG